MAVTNAVQCQEAGAIVALHIDHIQAFMEAGVTFSP